MRPRPLIEEGQVMQQPNERGQKDQQWSTKLKIEIHEPSYNPYNELTNWQWYK
jgi:hypothetical protein